MNNIQNNRLKSKILAIILLSGLAIQQANAAIALDRTRVVFDGGNNAVSLSVTNQNKELPYLAQGWLEDEQGNKIQSPLIVLPPVQRIEPGQPSQMKIQSLPAIKLLPSDRETLYYFNLREIPPKNDKANTLQIALQTRIKLFYRPEAIEEKMNVAPPQEQMTLSREGDKYVVNNTTPYYVTIVAAGSSKDSESVKGFEPLMLAPKSSAPLKANISTMGNSPVLTYINDYGGRPQLTFSCSSNSCKVTPEKLNAS
ncbi:fimbria/pilus periplasmic chaperone [Yersinia kristensenii]|uniref:fimbria/pilus periplasmic chaperone n=1 Tax=Yersinia kristensenii TaxID=28152 RepID=UPI001C610B0F|nr:fimbria/pilus periplasmic chaperone [Yersinia kristensenii]MBW5812537.1 fimbria/pilus periplasmic chaperone [Yersinia kristensenii]MBW5817915.1 fimbria/pilus periplasmic chaperone [Yersinia kristensenii]MBW5829838.1 fimbria/pilus periplasmic chaperone [Yersinia kristensenii]MBW5842231.1 fimbria/pilus periplasmic chaperone [Yersinia kristensenii]MDA5490307.1 fimbria/pilus periplasmic chaperone [Yersinia kristensenii]